MPQKKAFTVALSTLSGSSFPNFLKVVKGRKVESAYRSKFYKTAAVSLVSEPFRWIDDFFYTPKAKKVTLDFPPVFIIGHWRSGTTHLHNLMTQDPRFGYVTTFQGVFPNQFLGSGWLFKNMMKALMPDKRPSDNMALDPDLPQEEEFALGNIHPHSYYHFWFFPQDTLEYSRRYLKMEGFSRDEQKLWKHHFDLLMKKALLNTRKTRFVSKNPPHTARIPLLLEMYPDARFIYIYRNPYVVFESTRKLIQTTIPPLHFQSFTEEQLEENILQVYRDLLLKYEADKHLIPDENMLEIKFEDFEKDNLSHIREIYQKLRIPGFSEVETKFRDYVDSQKEYEKNLYNLDERIKKKIEANWGFMIEKGNYTI